MASGTSNSPMIIVTGLNIFPIKSCKGCQVEEITTDKYGVQGDRRLMLVDGRNRFISQRKYPALATISAKWTEVNTRLHVSAPKMDRDLEVAINREGTCVETTIWEDTVLTVDQGEEASTWFSQFLGISGNYIRLMATADESSGYCRPLGSEYPDSLKQSLPLMQVGLSDASPISIVSNESLADLNEKMKERCEGHTVPLSRFRMNIELSGCGRPFEEDEWLLIRVGTTPLLLFAGNSRCKVPGINQDTGETDKLGPLEILRQYRAPGGPNRAMFGQYALSLQVGSKISVGDIVTVLDKKKTQ